MEKARLIIKSIANETARAVLFHSASGKDSIALLHLLAPYFDEIVCVYMYLVKGLSHINRYINYASVKYPNAKFIQVPHYALGSYLQTGYMGCRQNEQQKQFTMSDLTEAVRNKYGIDWAFFGFKQSDSMNRRIMLRGYEDEAINRGTKKCYPLSSYHNNDVLSFIEENGLIKPERYGKGQSSGTNISNIDYLLWLRENYPQDLQKVYDSFPLSERLIFEYDYAEKFRNNSN